MTQNQENSELSLKQYGVRYAEGSFNLNSGKLEEVLLEVVEGEITNGALRWYSVLYSIDLGTARIESIPEISNPQKLAKILARSDKAVKQIESVDNVEKWHERYNDSYETGVIMDGEDNTDLSHLIDREESPFDGIIDEEES